MLLDKSAILAAEDKKTEDVEVPEWGGTVRLSVMSGTARDAYEASLIRLQEDGTGERELSNIRAKLVSACMVDESGNPVFTADEVEQLGKKNGKVLDRLYDIANKLNSTTQEGVEAAAKNS